VGGANLPFDTGVSRVEKRKILIQLDGDPHPSVFDRVVAIDAGADEVFSYGNVTPENVREMVHGAIFTRGGPDLHRTAIFIGGSDVALAEKILVAALRHMIPQYGLRVSVMLDASGANTTAAAAVLAAGRHLDLAQAKALVLGGTGPVGQRVSLLLARAGADVTVGSRQQARAAAVCDVIREKVPDARLEPAGISWSADLASALDERTLVISAGAAGVQMLPRDARRDCPSLKVVIDLNAVPPVGVEGVEPTDKAKEHDGVMCYGALGVGQTKMKLHKAAIARLFESNDKLFDAEQVYALGASI
jgi:hypothetical protein